MLGLRPGRAKWDHRLSIDLRRTLGPGLQRCRLLSRAPHDRGHLFSPASGPLLRFRQIVGSASDWLVLADRTVAAGRLAASPCGVGSTAPLASKNLKSLHFAEGLLSRMYMKRGTLRHTLKQWKAGRTPHGRPILPCIRWLATGFSRRSLAGRPPRCVRLKGSSEAGPIVEA